MGVMPLALKKWITARNSHLVEEARGSSIANGCPVKTEHYCRLGFVEVLRGGAKLHASVTGSRVKHSSWLQHLGDLTSQTRFVIVNPSHLKLFKEEEEEIQL